MEDVNFLNYNLPFVTTYFDDIEYVKSTLEDVIFFSLMLLKFIVTAIHALWNIFLDI